MIVIAGEGMLSGAVQVIRALTGSDAANAAALLFVGAEVYEDVGGRPSRDPLEDEAHVLDAETLERRERGKIDGEVARLLGEGGA